MKFQLLNLFAWLGNIRRAPSSVPNPPIMATKNPGRGHLPRRTWAIVRDGDVWKFRHNEAGLSEPGPRSRADRRSMGITGKQARRMEIKNRRALRMKALEELLVEAAWEARKEEL